MDFLKTAVLCVAFACSAASTAVTIPEIPDVDIKRTKTSIILKKAGLIELFQYANTLSELKTNEVECITESDPAYNQLDFITDLMPPPFKPDESQEEKVEVSIEDFDRLIDQIRTLRRQLKPKKVFCSDV